MARLRFAISPMWELTSSLRALIDPVGSGTAPALDRAAEGAARRARPDPGDAHGPARHLRARLHRAAAERPARGARRAARGDAAHVRRADPPRARPPLQDEGAGGDPAVLRPSAPRERAAWPTPSPSTGSVRSSRTGRGSRRCCRPTSSIAPGSSPTAAPRPCSPTCTGSSTGAVTGSRSSRSTRRRSTSAAAGCCSCRARSCGTGPSRSPRTRGSRRSIYPARGIGTLWESGPTTPEALAALVGKTRAALLTALDAPRSTTEIARRLGVSAGGASQHLGVLKDGGLVVGRRDGRSVLYVRTQLADALVRGDA